MFLMMQSTCIVPLIRKWQALVQNYLCPMKPLDLAGVRMSLLAQDANAILASVVPIANAYDTDGVWCRTGLFLKTILYKGSPLFKMDDKKMQDI
jgi:hypothetical protein